MWLAGAAFQPENIKVGSARAFKEQAAFKHVKMVQGTRQVGPHTKPLPKQPGNPHASVLETEERNNGKGNQTPKNSFECLWVLYVKVVDDSIRLSKQ